MEYLYHYTKIDALASILQNKTIRFSSLDRMDDKQENQSGDIKNLGRFIYVSSWTDEKRESIPMWNMYASIESGVRIRLPKQPFMKHKISIEELKNIFKAPVTSNGNGNGLETIIPLQEMLTEGFVSSQAMLNEVPLFPVEYTDDVSKLYPKVYKPEEADRYSINFSLIGKCKNKRGFGHDCG